MKVTTREAITAAIKAISDNIEACGAFSQANPTVPLKDNPHFDLAQERAQFRQAFKTTPRQVSYHCPGCGLMYPPITKDLRTNCPCRSSEVEVVRNVRKPKV